MAAPRPGTPEALRPPEARTPARPRRGASVVAVRGWGWTGVMVFALVVLYVLSRWWFIDRFPYFSDEGLYANWAYQGAHSRHALFLSETIGREPLLIWLAIPWIKLGFNPLTAVRLVSATCGLLTVGVLGLLGRRLWGPGAGLLAAMLCVVLPFFVVHDGIGIYEPLVLLIMAGALYAQLELARRPEVRWGALLGVVLAAGVLTKQNTEPAIALVPLSLLCFDWAAPRRRRKLLTWLGAVALAGVMVLGAELLLRSSGYYPQLVAIRKTPWYTVRTLSQVVADPFGPTSAHAWSVFRATLAGYVTLPLLAVGAIGVLGAGRRHPRVSVVLLAWILVPLAVALLFSTYPFPRHVMYVLAPAIVLMAYPLAEGIRWARRRLPRRLAGFAAAGAGALLVLPALLLDARVLAHPATVRYPSLDDWQYVTGSPAGSIWPAIADIIHRRGTGPQAVILTRDVDTNVLQFLAPNHRFLFVGSSSTRASGAQFALAQNPPGIVDFGAATLMRKQHFAPLRRFTRPRPCSSPRPWNIPPCPPGGYAVTLYQRPRRVR